MKQIFTQNTSITLKKKNHKSDLLSTHQEFTLIDVFASAIRVLDFFAENQWHLKEEEVALSTLADKRLWIPDLEGLLKNELALGLDVFIETWKGHSFVNKVNTTVSYCLWDLFFDDFLY